MSPFATQRQLTLDVLLHPSAFMGSGSTGIAAETLGRGFIGIEQDEIFAETARLRIGHKHATIHGKV